MARPSLAARELGSVGSADGAAGRAEGFEASSPRNCRATMQMTAMRATRRAYSTREAPRSVSEKRARSQVARNS